MNYQNKSKQQLIKELKEAREHINKLDKLLIELKESKKKIKNSENRFEEIFKESNDPIFIADPETEKLVDCNNAAEKLIGYSRKKILSMRVRDLHPPEIVSETVKGFKEHAKGKTSIVESEVLTKTGNRVPVSINVTLFNSKGKTFIYGLFRDITERKKTEARLISLNKLEENLLGYGNLQEKTKQITDGLIECFQADFARIWITKPGDLCNSGCFHAGITEGPHVCRYRDKCLHLMASSGRYIHIDGKIHKRVPFGCYKIGRVAAGKDPGFLTNEVIVDSRVHDHKWAKKFGLVSFAGYKLQATDGQTIGVMALFSQQKISSEEKVLLETIAGIASQVIHSATIEEERRQTEKNLRESESKYRSLVENQILGVVIHLLSGRIVYANPAACKIMSADSMDKIVGKNVLDFVHPDFANSVTSRIQGVFESGISAPTHEERLINLDGNSVPVEINGAPISYLGEPAIMVMVTDITERKQAAEELTKHRDNLEVLVKERTAELEIAKEHAEAANRAKSTFLAHMSHELRTPLTAILGYTQLIKLQKDTTIDKIKEQLNTIQKSGEHLLNLINDILDFARIEAHKERTVFEKFNLKVLIQEVSSTIRVKSLEKKLAFIYEEVSVIPEIVKGDERKLKQVLINLLSNAVKYTEHGSVTLRVSCKEYKMGRKKRAYFSFEVQDTGRGIPQERLKYIFEPFSHLEADDKTIRGIGLGLSISKQLTDLMGGELLVNSKEGKGSTFTIKINLELVKASEPAIKLPTRTVIGYHGERKLILIADDNEENLAMLASMLEPLGFKIERASSGREVVKTASITQPDLILMDLLMPDMDGHEALKIIKQENKFPKIKIVGISAAIADKKRADKFIADCDDFILKPFVIQDLLEKIAKQLNIKWIAEKGKRPVNK